MTTPVLYGTLLLISTRYGQQYHCNYGVSTSYWMFLFAQRSLIPDILRILFGGSGNSLYPSRRENSDRHCVSDNGWPTKASCDVKLLKTATYRSLHMSRKKKGKRKRYIEKQPASITFKRQREANRTSIEFFVLSFFLFPLWATKIAAIGAVLVVDTSCYYDQHYCRQSTAVHALVWCLIVAPLSPLIRKPKFWYRAPPFKKKKNSPRPCRRIPSLFACRPATAATILVSP